MTGVLLVDKPNGLTSRDVVNKVCHVFNTKKVGHTGTLDPMATGVLVVTIGDATKIGEYLTSFEKEYVATCKLGILTDTLDTTGEILKTSNVSVSKNQVISALESFHCSYLQEVPKYSAVKINGKKLYELARNNVDVELPKREVTIKEIELLEYINDKEFKFRCVVSKGTYIRSLIRDIANELGTVGVMSSLRRTKQGKFSIDECIKLDEIDNNTNLIKIIDALSFTIIPLDNDENLNKVLNGATIKNKYNVNECLFTYKNKALGIYHKDKEYLKVKKMLLEK